MTDSKFSINIKKASFDLTEGIGLFPIWWGLAWLEIKQRYSRSVIGPFWITLSTGVMVAAMGPLYGALLGQNVAGYIQHLAVSLIIWNFISGSINDAGNAFVGAEGYIKQISLPLSVYVLKLIARNSLMLGHNFAVVFVVLYFLPPKNLELIWLTPIGLILVVGNLFWLALLLGMFSARFRDIPQLVSNIVQVAFFLSPIIWSAEMLPPSRRYLADFNPLFHFIEIVRAPLLGEPLHLISWIVVTAFLLIGSAVTFMLFARFRARVPYWL
jgi:ABC-type polysaccharide/polyol phosphate export permease